MAYSNAQEVELLLNGRSLGRKKTFTTRIPLPTGPNISPTLQLASKYRLLWSVPYQPGKLMAVGYSDGKEIARDEVNTAGDPARITLSPDRSSLVADGDDLSFVTVRIEDSQGHLAPRADNLVTFQVWGAGNIAGVDNGNPATTEAFQANYRQAFNGLALLILRSKPGEVGQIHVRATAVNLAAAELVISTR
jgi:beta-galactosidase